MKAGNISPAAELTQAIPGVRAQGNVDSSAEAKTGSFQMYLAANTKKSSEADILPVSSGNGVKKAAGEGEKDFAKLQENSVKDKITGEAEQTGGLKESGQTGDKKPVTEAEERIAEAVKEELGLTDEELEKALAELGICAAELVIPQNVAALVAKVNDTDVTSIVTDEELTDQLTNLLAAVDTAIADTSEQFGLKPEQLVQELTQPKPEQNQNQKPDESKDGEVEILQEAAKEPEKQPEFVVVKDGSTQKEIKVTVEDNRVTDSAAAGYTRTPEIEKETPDSGQQKRQNDGSGQKDSSGFAQNLIQNLNQVFTERTEGVQSFTQSYTVTPTDIMNQVIEAIRVNVNQTTSSMEIQLNPENLGKINLNVATRNGVVTATITAQNEAVKGVIESQIVQLRESLNNQGLKVQSVEVAVANHGFDLGENNAGQEQNNNGASHRRRNFNGYDDASEEDGDMRDVLEQRIMEANGGSVNYTA